MNGNHFYQKNLVGKGAIIIDEFYYQLNLTIPVSYDYCIYLCINYEGNKNSGGVYVRGGRV